MAEKPRIFLSAVTKELGSIRDQLAVELRRRGCEVAVQEEFRTTSGTLLEKLHDYILECHAVVCLMGERYGAEPPSAEATRYAFSFTKDGSETGATPRHSYTQWEYLFARRMNKATFVFLPSKTAPRDPSHKENPEPEDLQQLQQHFIQKDVRLDGRDRTTFDSLEQLKDHLAAIDFQKLLHAEYHQVPLKTENPYIGLRHFEETERDYFFGRDRLIADLITAMEGSPLLMVLGASGSGKSSAVRAGLIPSWRERTGRKGRVVEFTPDEDAFEGFYLGLNRAGYSQNDAKPAKTPSPNVIRERFDALQNADEPWLIFIDQFEQIFTRTPGRDEAKKVAFIAALVDVASDPPDGLRVVLAMRDDFFSNLEGYPALFAITDKHFRRVARMDEGELRAVIQRPAAAHGVAFEPGLVRLILDDLADSRGRLPLPYLQYTLEALWEKDKPTDRVLNIDSYKAIGGVRGALQQQVTSYFKGLGAADQQSLRRILLRLVEIGETQVPVSRAARKADLATGNDATVLEQLLSERKLLVAQKDSGVGRGDSVVELAHEALITGWDEFEKWVNESREAIALRNRLREDAEAYVMKKDARSAVDRRRAKDELWTGSRLIRTLELRDAGDFERIGGLSERERVFLDESESAKKVEIVRLQRRLAILSVLAVLAVVGMAYGWSKAKEAEKERDTALKTTARLDGICRSIFPFVDWKSDRPPHETESILRNMLEHYNTSSKRDLDAVQIAFHSSTLNRLADLCLADGRTDEALSLYEKAVSLNRQALDSNPGDNAAAQSFTTSLNRVTMARRKIAVGLTGDDRDRQFEEALKLSEESIEFSLRQAERSGIPADEAAYWVHLVGAAYIHQGDSYNERAKAGDRQAAVAAFSKAIAAYESAKKGPGPLVDAKLVEAMNGEIERLKTFITSNPN